MNKCCKNCTFCMPMAEEEYTCDCQESEGYGLSIPLDGYCMEFESKVEDDEEMN